MKRFLLLPLLVASFAYAQPVQRSIPSCGVTVTFSGIPTSTPQSLIDFLRNKGMGPQSDGFAYKTEYDGSYTIETALCLCPDLAIADALSRDVNSMRAQTLWGVGSAVYMPPYALDNNGAKNRTRIVGVKSKPLCFLQQEAITNKSDAALKDLATGYFDRLLKPLE
jgi:hypothetical protein